MSVELHIANIEREAEVLKNVVRDLCTELFVMVSAQENGRIADRALELRDEVDNIFPNRKR